MANDSADICSLDGITGPCHSLIDSWYYDEVNDQCTYFTWSGCGGNDNRFETVQSCQEICMDIESDTSDSDATFSGYHIAGLVMIFIVIYLFFILYYLTNRQQNKTFEPHQHRAVIKDKPNNKYNTKDWLYVSNIAKKIYESDIRQLFEDYGQILQFEFRETRGDQLNICFVQFKSIDDAQRAMGELNAVEIEENRICIQSGSVYKPESIALTLSQKVSKTSTKSPSKNGTQTGSQRTMVITVENVDETPSLKGEQNKDINEIIKEKNFLMRNPRVLSPTVRSEAISSMYQVDSDFNYYDTDNADGLQSSSDSDAIDFADNNQRSALKQFVDTKLTPDVDNLNNHYNDYVGIGIEED